MARVGQPYQPDPRVNPNQAPTLTPRYADPGRWSDQAGGKWVGGYGPQGDPVWDPGRGRWMQGFQSPGWPEGGSFPGSDAGTKYITLNSQGTPIYTPPPLPTPPEVEARLNQQAGDRKQSATQRGEDKFRAYQQGTGYTRQTGGKTTKISAQQLKEQFERNPQMLSNYQQWAAGNGPTQPPGNGGNPPGAPPPGAPPPDSPPPGGGAPQPQPGTPAADVQAWRRGALDYRQQLKGQGLSDADFQSKMGQYWADNKPGSVSAQGGVPGQSPGSFPMYQDASGNWVTEQAMSTTGRQFPGGTGYMGQGGVPMSYNLGKDKDIAAADLARMNDWQGRQQANVQHAQRQTQDRANIASGQALQQQNQQMQQQAATNATDARRSGMMSGDRFAAMAAKYAGGAQQPPPTTTPPPNTNPGGQNPFPPPNTNPGGNNPFGNPGGNPFGGGQNPFAASSAVYNPSMQAQNAMYQPQGAFQPQQLAGLMQSMGYAPQGGQPQLSQVMPNLGGAMGRMANPSIFNGGQQNSMMAGLFGGGRSPFGNGYYY